MSYRVQVDPEAGQVLRTLRAHVVQHLGRLLAELAELVSSSSSSAQPTLAREGNVALLEVDDYVLLYEVDRAERTLNVRSVQPRELRNMAAPA